MAFYYRLGSKYLNPDSAATSIAYNAPIGCIIKVSRTEGKEILCGVCKMLEDGGCLEAVY